MAAGGRSRASTRTLTHAAPLQYSRLAFYGPLADHSPRPNQQIPEDRHENETIPDSVARAARWQWPCSASRRARKRASGRTTAFPKAAIKAKYKFDVTDAWLKHLQLATVRFGGGTGSIVSPDGLVLTNHHIGLGTAQRLSTAREGPRQERLLRGDARRRVEGAGHEPQGPPEHRGRDGQGGIRDHARR